MAAKKSRYAEDPVITKAREYAELMRSRGRKPVIALPKKDKARAKKIVRHTKDVASKYVQYE